MDKQKLQILVENGDRLLFASDRGGLDPLREAAFNHPELLDGSDIAMPAIGLAAAYLLIYGKAGRVFAHHMTTAARAAFKEEGIEHQAKSYSKTLPKKLAEPFVRFENLSKEAVTPLAFVEMVKRRGS